MEMDIYRETTSLNFFNPSKAATYYGGYSYKV
jgi:hypothetical protein